MDEERTTVAEADRVPHPVLFTWFGFNSPQAENIRQRKGPTVYASKQKPGNSLAVQWLGLHALTAGAGVCSLVGELGSRKSRSAAKKKKKTTPNFKNNLFILFIYFWLRWVFIAPRRLSLVVGSRGYSSLQSTGFSWQWLLLLRSMGSRRAGFSSCGMQAQ